jgi:hypothetical protein
LRREFLGILESEVGGAAGNGSRPGYADVMPMPESSFDEPAPLPDYSEDGVDLTVIRWMLSLTPQERLQFLEERISDILAIRALNANE